MTRAAGWTLGGASVIGPLHVRAGMPNQDALAFRQTRRHGCMAVADGLGSRPHSDTGARAVCRAAVSVAMRHLRAPRRRFDRRRLLDEIRSEWLAAIRPFTPEDCATTCLLAMWSLKKVRLFQIGDGLAAFVSLAGRVRWLADDKSSSFSNLVSPLAAATVPGEWRYACCDARRCRGVLLCTDGISEDLADVPGFAAACVDDLRSVPDGAEARWTEMLRRWPVPAHSDDKTLAVAARKEARP